MKIAAFLVSALLGLCAVPAIAALQPGADAPMFEAPAALGGEPFEFSLADALADGPVVLYFYPKAFTKGCTIEAHLFAEATDEFASLGATVIGMSADDIDTLKRFSTEACRDRFAVGADPKLDITKAYDARMLGVMPVSSRVSYVISPEGKILSALSESKPEPHISQALEVLRRWKAEQN